ncbi:MAG: ABC transporter substrate-binding protein [Rhodoferax sp.]|nr:ABC transporter substrate-binding protein [Rhodoferax sp.]
MKSMVSGALALACLAPAAMAQTLKIGLAASPTSVDPQFYVIGSNSALARNVFDGLVNQDDRQQIRPALAKSWKAVDDKTWEFQLREGVTFHDGSALDPQDVIASLARVKLAATNSPSSFVAYVKGIESVTAAGPMTVRIKTEAPMPLLPNDMSRIAILPSEHGQTPTATLNAGTGVIGTGPYRFSAWTPGNEIKLARFDKYWGNAPPWSDVTMRVFTDANARVAALLAGDVDVIEAVPSSSVQTLKKNPAINVVSLESNRVMYLHMDQDREVSPFAAGPDGKNPLRNAKVRKAISMAIAREAIVQRVMEGLGVPAGQLVPKGYFGFVPDLPVEPYNPEKAKALLAEAGYPNGFTLTFHASNDRYPNDSLVAQAIGQMLTRIGIKTSIVTLPASVYFSRASKLEFSFIMGGAAVETGEASGVLGPLLETHSPTSGQGNRGRYSSKAFDEALQSARATVDADARQNLLQKASRIAMTDLGVIPVFYLANTWAVRSGLRIDGRTDGYTLAQDVRPAK